MDEDQENAEFDDDDWLAEYLKDDDIVSKQSANKAVCSSSAQQVVDQIIFENKPFVLQTIITYCEERNMSLSVPAVKRYISALVGTGELLSKWFKEDKQRIFWLNQEQLQPVVDGENLVDWETIDRIKAAQLKLKQRKAELARINDEIEKMQKIKKEKEKAAKEDKLLKYVIAANEAKHQFFHMVDVLARIAGVSNEQMLDILKRSNPIFNFDD